VTWSSTMDCFYRKVLLSNPGAAISLLLLEMDSKKFYYSSPKCVLLTRNYCCCSCIYWFSNLLERLTGERYALLLTNISGVSESECSFSPSISGDRLMLGLVPLLFDFSLFFCVLLLLLLSSEIGLITTMAKVLSLLLVAGIYVLLGS